MTGIQADWGTTRPLRKTRSVLASSGEAAGTYEYSRGASGLLGSDAEEKEISRGMAIAGAAAMDAELIQRYHE